ncbi:hypothetical protein LCGC14_0872600 [marine sediment metagenome]|uniref:Zinc/iron-chelating domain-containing protein n=1 Tax=marine sediment metagenome TaxID=412755 RepID=A0A0F9PPS8_9ZZZZ
MEKYINKALCKKCGGNCCKGMPGMLHPRDFKNITHENIVELLKTGNYAIDWYGGDPRKGKDELGQAYYLRPRTENNKDIFDPSWGGVCIFLLKNGCKLEYNERPYQCRMIEPKRNGGCIAHGLVSKRKISIKWLPYQDIIYKAGKSIEG